MVSEKYTQNMEMAMWWGAATFKRGKTLFGGWWNVLELNSGELGGGRVRG